MGILRTFGMLVGCLLVACGGGPSGPTWEVKDLSGRVSELTREEFLAKHGESPLVVKVRRPGEEEWKRPDQVPGLLDASPDPSSPPTAAAQSPAAAPQTRSPEMDLARTRSEILGLNAQQDAAMASLNLAACMETFHSASPERSKIATVIQTLASSGNRFTVENQYAGDPFASIRDDEIRLRFKSLLRGTAGGYRSNIQEGYAIFRRDPASGNAWRIYQIVTESVQYID